MHGSRSLAPNQCMGCNQCMGTHNALLLVHTTTPCCWLLLLQVMPEDRRVQMRCTAGCLMMWHQNCWRPFQELWEHETRDPSSGQGVNITQVCVNEGIARCCKQYFTLTHEYHVLSA